METRLERVGDLKVVKQSSIGYILENGVEIVDTFAEMFHHTATVNSVLDNSPFFWSPRTFWHV